MAYCIENKKVLETMSLEEYKNFDATFENDLYEAISLETCVEKRISLGGTSKVSVEKQIDYITEFLANEKGIH